jgi:uncharacterized ferredoxin-like protein
MVYKLTKELIDEAVVEISRYLLLAAETAPKGRGVNSLKMMILDGKEKDDLAKQMRLIGEQNDVAFFIRDAENVEVSSAVILLGCENIVRNLNCGLCGSPSCSEKAERYPCVFNTVDLGIALGSAVSSAANFKIDTRIMYSAGKTAMEMRLLGENISCLFAIPLSVSAKNVFFDRK